MSTVKDKKFIEEKLPTGVLAIYDDSNRVIIFSRESMQYTTFIGDPPGWVYVSFLDIVAGDSILIHDPDPSSQPRDPLECLVLMIQSSLPYLMIIHVLVGGIPIYKRLAPSTLVYRRTRDEIEEARFY
jgi:hypothetical protein